MKYLITESQFNKIVSNYLDSQKFELRDKGSRLIRLMRPIIDIDPEVEYPSDMLLYDDFIMYDKESKVSMISKGLMDEIRIGFSVDSNETIADLINKWLLDRYDFEVLKSRQFLNDSDIRKTYESMR